MCMLCSDLDKKRPSECSGERHPFLTLQQLLEDVRIEAKRARKHVFRIFKEALINPPAVNELHIDKIRIELV